MKKWIIATVVVAFFVLGFLIQLDQYFRIGLWFQPEDIHHETFALAAIAIGIGIIIGTVLKGDPNNQKTKPL